RRQRDVGLLPKSDGMTLQIFPPNQQQVPACDSKTPPHFVPLVTWHARNNQLGLPECLLKRLVHTRSNVEGSRFKNHGRERYHPYRSSSRAQRGPSLRERASPHPSQPLPQITNSAPHHCLRL